MAGSFGVTDVLKIYHNIVNAEPDFQVILITGRNEKLYETFDRYLSKTILQNALIAEFNSEQEHLLKLLKSQESQSHLSQLSFCILQRKFRDICIFQI